MAGNQESGCRQLALKIEKQLKSGIAVSRDTLHFMASTFSIESPQELAKLLSDPDDSESQSLMELLFTPNESIQSGFEEMIQKQGYTVKDQQSTIRLLFQKQVEAPIRFPGDGGKITFIPPEHLLETYVLNLKITKQLPTELIAAVYKYAAVSIRSAIKVKLRNTRVVLCRSVRSFLCRFLEKTDTAGKHFLTDLDLCLSVLSEQPGTPALFDLFMGKKRSLLVALQQAERFEKQLANDNIETLILKGVRTPHIDKAEVKKQTFRIDAICLAVFGITDPLLQIPTDVDLGNFSDRDDLKKAFEMLS
jgi:hypothetical protein